MGGCTRCTLSAGLLADLHKLDSDGNPDLVILETTGAARPADVVEAQRYDRGRPLQDVRTMVLVDPLRLTKAARIIGPLIESQVAPADVLVVNKTDLATARRLPRPRATSRRSTPEPPCCAHRRSAGSIPPSWRRFCRG